MEFQRHDCAFAVFRSPKDLRTNFIGSLLHAGKTHSRLRAAVIAIHSTAVVFHPQFPAFTNRGQTQHYLAGVRMTRRVVNGFQGYQQDISPGSQGEMYFFPSLGKLRSECSAV